MDENYAFPETVSLGSLEYVVEEFVAQLTFVSPLFSLGFGEMVICCLFSAG